MGDEKPNLPASDRYMVLVAGASQAIQEWMVCGKLPENDIMVEIFEHGYLVTKPEWEMFLPDAIHHLGTSAKLAPEMMDKLNAFIKNQNIQMSDHGFEETFVIPLVEKPPDDQISE
jgi:hypothetical protein